MQNIFEFISKDDGTLCTFIDYSASVTIKYIHIIYSFIYFQMLSVERQSKDPPPAFISHEPWHPIMNVLHMLRRQLLWNQT